MKKLIWILSISLGLFINAQEKVYHPEADAKADIQKALKQAQEEHKNVIIQVGGNWCSWCLLFNQYIHENKEIADYIDQNFVYYHLNYSKENKNEDILSDYGNPQKNGFPVLLVLYPNGTLAYTQETGSLEEGKGYNFDKVMGFLQEWSPKQERFNSH